MKRVKLGVGLLYIVVIAVMAITTIIEKYEGTAFVSDRIYGAWWFSLLWGLLAAAGITWFVKRRVRRFTTVVLHLSLTVILLGALLTHLTAARGTIHLRQGETVDTYLTESQQERALPFSISLDAFNITYHKGTKAPADFTSQIIITAPHTGSRQTTASVSMNQIVSHRGYRLYQSGFDPDGQGTILALNYDPWGIPVTYCGYALLFFALVWMLISPDGTYRQLLRKASLTCLLTVMVCGDIAAAATALPPTLPKETAARFGRLNMLYNDRVCPVQTYALDFTRKLCGSRSYKGLSAEQVLTGFIFWPDAWRNEPILKIKGGVLKETLQLPDYCSTTTFFNPSMGGYILGPYIEQYYNGQHDKFHNDVAKMDDRLMLVMELCQGTPLRLFPSAEEWYAPVGKLPATIDNDTQRFIRSLFRLLSDEAQAGHYDQMDHIIDKLQRYQQQQGGGSIPSDFQLQAEYIYNKVSLTTILFMANLALGLLSLIVFMAQGRQSSRPRPTLAFHHVFISLFIISFLALTFCLALRWIITGHVPMANGYETMLALAWLIMLFSLIAHRRFPIAMTFGFLLSGLFLLVSHLGQMDAQIGHLMPVLNSPLLSLHVSIIMVAYALLSLTFVCSATALLLPAMQQQLHLLSRLLLYPALTTLGLGIFIGAIWANVSWGTYWSWDPKETWALITFMIYAIPVHTQSLSAFRRPLAYHVYMAVAFLTILMTYFGVNYLLGGMHSYA